MGNCVSAIKSRKEPNKAITLAIIGLDNAGKTTLCYVLTGEQLDPDIAPTVGFRNIKFSYSNFDVTVFDLGGGENIRPIWKTYFGELFGLIYVIDSSTPARLSEARDVFRETLQNPQVSGKPVLILANKVDKEEHMKENDIVSGLQLDSTLKRSNCPSQLVMVSALRGVGSKMDQEIQRGLKWLFDKIRNSLSSLEPRIDEDMKAAKEAREKEREERKARVKKQREEREKAEEMERTRLGLTKKEDSDEDDIIVGDPFKALDLEKLKKKEQQLKEEKQLKKKRMEELANKKESEEDEKHTDDLRIAKEKLKKMTVNKDMIMEGLSLSQGLTIHLDETDTPTLPSHKRNTQALPPLESHTQNNLSTSADRKKRRKKKKLTDYHRTHDNDLNLPNKDESVVSLESSPRENASSIGSARNILEHLPELDKPRVSKSLTMAEISDSEKEFSHFKLKKWKHMKQENDDEVQGYSKRYFTSNLPQTLMERTEETHLKGGDTLSNSSKGSKSHQSVQKKYLTSANGLHTDAKGDNSEKSTFDEPIQNLNDNTLRKSSRRQRNNSLTNLLSDEENNSYESPNSLKDTLRSPLSPEYLNNLRKSNKEMNNLRQHRNNGEDNFSHLPTHEGFQNGGFTGYSSKNKPNYDDDGDTGRSQTNSIHSLNRDEEEAFKNTVSEKSGTRKKKKHNILRSNKIAPLDEENPKTNTEETPTSFHKMSELESRNNLPEAKPRVKNRNTTMTAYQEKITGDSDFSLKWELAEDLPAVDGNSGGYRVPNFDSNDEDDIQV